MAIPLLRDSSALALPEFLSNVASPLPTAIVYSVAAVVWVLFQPKESLFSVPVGVLAAFTPFISFVTAGRLLPPPVTVPGGKQPMPALLSMTTSAPWHFPLASGGYPGPVPALVLWA